jgi:hypothetical protein
MKNMLLGLVNVMSFNVNNRLGSIIENVWDNLMTARPGGEAGGEGQGQAQGAAAGGWRAAGGRSIGEAAGRWLRRLQHVAQRSMLDSS